MAETEILQGAGTFTLGGVTEVVRLGYGAMQITGPGVWGEPADRPEAIRVLRRAVELGVTLIDTADAYGPFVSEQLIHEALHPYPEELVIATKAGLTRQGPGRWTPVGRPEYLRQQAELSLRHLGVEQIDLLQLHRIDPQVPLEDQVGELHALKQEGKVRHIGLSEVTVEQLESARAITEIVSVQNLYNLSNRSADALVDHVTEQEIAFIPWFPLQTGKLTEGEGALARIAAEHDATPAQVALAWLLRRSPAILPIPGTSRVTHLEENLASAGIELSDEQFDQLAG
jgi:aryl-alcohol dehydrogenase-like predicted oxidoreductase